MMTRGATGWPPRAPLMATLLVVLATTVRHWTAAAAAVGGDKKFGDKCRYSAECGFEGSLCDEISGTCLCKPDLVTNHLDKCGVAAKVNESCFFNEQCETVYYLTECREGVCTCRFQKQAIIKPDGSVECISVQTTVTAPRYVDPAMIGILVAMILMFITICVVLRLFSKARWRENRTIFNTPNPRLMNVSLLRDNKHDRRGSRASARGPSRGPSMASLRAHSPSPGSRRGSKGSLASATSSVKSQPVKSATVASNHHQEANANPTATAASPMLESVTVEVPRQHKEKHEEKA